MKFITVQDLKKKSDQIWNDLPDEQEMIITNNGKPVAILSAANENNLETSLNSIRRALVIEAVSSIQNESIKKGTNKITLDDINQEITDLRKA